MVWRKSYSTKILYDLACPATLDVSLDGSDLPEGRQVWIGGFGFEAVADQGVWWRLFQSDFPGDSMVRKVFICPSVGTVEMQTALSLVPRSESSRCLLVEDVASGWNQLIQPEDVEQGFAAIMEGTKITLLMIGPPTEDAWEEFSHCWRTKT